MNKAQEQNRFFKIIILQLKRFEFGRGEAERVNHDTKDE